MNIKTITLAAGDIVPALGQGTWYLGDDPAKRAQEVSALRTGMGAGAAVCAGDGCFRCFRLSCALCTAG